jgi:hypothetical protein
MSLQVLYGTPLQADHVFELTDVDLDPDSDEEASSTDPFRQIAASMDETEFVRLKPTLWHLFSILLHSRRGLSTEQAVFHTTLELLSDSLSPPPDPRTVAAKVNAVAVMRRTRPDFTPYDLTGVSSLCMVGQ